jgi:Family of unknown function (DUF6489)
VKFNVEVECTAEEAREFLGLPDLKAMQAAVLAPLQQRMVDATTSLSPEGLLKTWLSLVPTGSEQYLKTFTNLFTPTTSEKPPSSSP